MVPLIKTTRPIGVSVTFSEFDSILILELQQPCLINLISKYKWDIRFKEMLIAKILPTMQEQRTAVSGQRPLPNKFSSSCVPSVFLPSPKRPFPPNPARIEGLRSRRPSVPIRPIMPALSGTKGANN